MAPEKVNSEAADQVFNILQDQVIKPLVNSFSTWDCKPIDVHISTNTYMHCYTELYHLFATRNQNNDNYQEYIYNQAKAAIKTYYSNLEKNYKPITNQNTVLEVFCCKWEQMTYLTKALKTSLSYIEQNYIERTQKTPVNAIIKNYFIKYIYNRMETSVRKAIKSNIHEYRHNSSYPVSPKVSQAVIILYECKEDNKDSKGVFLKSIIDDASTYYSECKLNLSSISTILNQLQTVCDFENKIVTLFSIDPIASKLQDIVISSLLKKDVDNLSLVLDKFMSELYPTNLESFHQLIQYADHFKGIDIISDYFKKLLIKIGMSCYNDFKQKYDHSPNHKKINRNYIQALAEEYFQTYNIIKNQLDAVPALFQALYSAVSAVTDKWLGSDSSVAVGLAECIDHMIRKESLNPVEMTTRLNKILFLYANINNKDDFTEAYNILLSRRLLYGSDSKYDYERNIISMIKSSTGLLSVSVMDSILNDMNNSMSDTFNRKIHDVVNFPDFKYSINVLTNGVWPSLPESEFENLDETKNVHCPSEMQAVIDAFNALPEDSEKTYKWSFVRGYVTMQMNVHGHMIMMQMLPIQCMVLMLFQHDEVYSVKQICDQLNVNLQLIQRVLASLIYSKFNLLKCVDDTKHYLKEDDLITFNTAFNTDIDMIRLKGLEYSHKDDHEQNAVLKHIEAYKACIVRIVKKHESIDINDLKSQVLSEMKEWNMNEEDFSKCIDALIESEYIERNQNNRNIIQYA